MSIDRFSISSAIPDGSIDVISDLDREDIQLRIKEDDSKTPAFYFHFRSIGSKGHRCTFRLLNAHESISRRLPGRDEVEHAWETPGVMASYDLEHWFRVPGKYNKGEFEFAHIPEHDVCYYSSWPPYSLERLGRLVAQAQQMPHVHIATLGKTVEGRDLELMVIGNPSAQKRKCWVLARQHPSETMSSFFVEGFIRHMLDESNPLVAELLEQSVFYVVPNMNPDGTVYCTTRNNAAGRNLNRAWLEPDPEKEPEVHLVRSLMREIGVDFCIDCHGDRELRCNFLGGPLEIPSRSKRLDDLFVKLQDTWTTVTPEYERGHPYPGGAPAEADLSMAWNWIAEEFDCLSVLLEQPFKDTSWRTDAKSGWTPQRSMAFGKSLADVLVSIVQDLR